MGRCSILITCGLLFIGCSNPVQTKNAQGADHTSIEHVTKKKYNANGDVVSIQDYLKNDTGLIADGPFKDFYDDGALKSSGTYKNGKFEGFIKNYHPNGNMIQKMHFSNDSFIGGQYEYYDNGVIKSYDFFVTTTARRFTIHFDEKGNIIKDQTVGKPLSLIVIDEKSAYDSTDTIVLNLIIAKPEHVKTKLTVLYQKPNINYKVEMTDKNYNYFDFANTHYTRVPYLGIKGSGRVTATLKLYDSVTNRLITTDSVKYDIIVKQ